MLIETSAKNDPARRVEGKQPTWLMLYRYSNEHLRKMPGQILFSRMVPGSMFYSRAEVQQGDSATVLPSFGYQQSILSRYTMVLFYFLSPFIRPKWDWGDLFLFCELNEQCDLIRFAAVTKIIENPCK